MKKLSFNSQIEIYRLKIRLILLLVIIEELKGLHALRHLLAGGGPLSALLASSPLNLTVKQVADLLGHTTTEITELYYVKKDNTKLEVLIDAFNL